MIRETVDTGELGEFMPQLRALASVNPDSEHFAVSAVSRYHQRDDPSGRRGGGGGGRFGGARQYISGQAALIHTLRLDLGEYGRVPSGRDCVSSFPAWGRPEAAEVPSRLHCGVRWRSRCDWHLY